LEAIGVEPKRAGALTTLLEYHSDRVRTLETTLPNAPQGERVDSERVLLAPDFDHGIMANPEERARRLAVARDNDLMGAYIGDKGASRFHAEDKAAVEAKWDLPRTLQRATEEREAKARARAEAAKLQAPLDQATALRQEKLKLETE